MLYCNSCWYPKDIWSIQNRFKSSKTKELSFQLIGQYLQLIPMWHTHLEHHTVWKENVFQPNVSSLDSAAPACDVAEADSMSRFLGKNNKSKNKTHLYIYLNVYIYMSKDFDWLKKWWFTFVGALPLARPHLEHINTDQRFDCMHFHRTCFNFFNLTCCTAIHVDIPKIFDLFKMASSLPKQKNYHSS